MTFRRFWVKEPRQLKKKIDENCYLCRSTHPKAGFLTWGMVGAVSMRTTSRELVIRWLRCYGRLGVVMFARVLRLCV